MAINLIDLVQRNLTGPVVRQLGSLLGESEAATQSAVDMAVPATIGALMKQASSPTGANELAAQLDRTDTSFLGNLASSLGVGARSLMDTGANAAHGLFGSKLGSIADSLSRASGMGKGAIGSLLSLITPIVMGFLSRTKKEQGLDASGLSSLLGGQSSFLSGLLPAGLGETLGISSLLGTAGAKARATAERAGEYAADAGRAAVRTTQRAAEEGGSFLRKLLPILALVLLGLFIWTWFSRRSSKVEAALPPRGVTVDAQGELTALVDRATGALRGVTDADSARAAVPELQAATRSIETLSSSLGSMTSTARASLGSAASTAMTSLKSLADRALAIPGVSDVLQPALTSLTNALAKLRA